MRLRTITGTDLHASVICLGALPFGVTLSEDLSFTLMDRFLAEGGNFIDTALVYGEWLPDGKGRSERTVGKWVKQRRTRDRVIIGTKGAHPRLSSMDVPRLARDEIVADLDESLGNLQTDYIDLYWLHRDDPRRPVAEILHTLNEQGERGKIRYFGCSNWRLDRIQAAQDYAAEHGIRGFAGNQLMWSLAVPNHAALFDPAMVTMDAVTRPTTCAQGWLPWPTVRRPAACSPGWRPARRAIYPRVSAPCTPVKRICDGCSACSRSRKRRICRSAWSHWPIWCHTRSRRTHYRDARIQTSCSRTCAPVMLNWSRVRWSTSNAARTRACLTNGAGFAEFLGGGDVL